MSVGWSKIVVDKGIDKTSSLISGKWTLWLEWSRFLIYIYILLFILLYNFFKLFARIRAFNFAIPATWMVRPSMARRVDRWYDHPRYKGTKANIRGESSETTRGEKSQQLLTACSASKGASRFSRCVKKGMRWRERECREQERKWCSDTPRSEALFTRERTVSGSCYGWRQVS